MTAQEKAREYTTNLQNELGVLITNPNIPNAYIAGYQAAMKEKDLEISLLHSKIEELQEDLNNKQAGAPWMQ